MPVLLVLCRQPQHLGRDEALGWMRDELRTVAADLGATDVVLQPLMPGGRRLPRTWDWLVRLRLTPEADPGRVLDGQPCAALLGDLRLLGMDPTVLVVTDAELGP